jgi:hypothetical protein
MSPDVKFFLMLIALIYGIVLIMTIFSLLLPVFGQVKQPNIPANPAVTTIQANSLSTDNLRLQEQKGWLFVEPPPNIPSAQNIGGMDYGSVMGYVATAVAAFNSWQNKKQGDVQKAQGAVQVQQATVQKESLKLQYDNMGEEKANAINNRPEIQLKEVEKLEKKAIDTNAKS